jgi:hypothetical protein
VSKNTAQRALGFINVGTGVDRHADRIVGYDSFRSHFPRTQTAGAPSRSRRDHRRGRTDHVVTFTYHF